MHFGFEFTADITHFQRGVWIGLLQHPKHQRAQLGMEHRNQADWKIVTLLLGAWYYTLPQEQHRAGFHISRSTGAFFRSLSVCIRQIGQNQIFSEFQKYPGGDSLVLNHGGRPLENVHNPVYLCFRRNAYEWGIMIAYNSCYKLAEVKLCDLFTNANIWCYFG